MYGIGLLEIFIVFLVLLLFFKPKDIFSLFRKAGAWYSRLKEIEKEIREDLDLSDSSSNQNNSFGFDTENPEGADEEDKSL